MVFTPDFLTMVATCLVLTIGATEALKRWTGAGGPGAVLISFVVSAGVCGAHVWQSGDTWLIWAALTVATFLEANGFYKFKNGRRP